MPEELSADGVRGGQLLPEAERITLNSQVHEYCAGVGEENAQIGAARTDRAPAPAQRQPFRVTLAFLCIKRQKLDPLGLGAGLPTGNVLAQPA